MGIGDSVSPGYAAFNSSRHQLSGIALLLKVIYVYLITIELGESPERVGFASSMLLVPSLLFALFGGTTADKFDIRKILIWLQCFSGLATVVLALAMELGFLSYSLLIAYALFVGTIDPFVIPARNSLLNRVASEAVSKGVEWPVSM